MAGARAQDTVVAPHVRRGEPDDADAIAHAHILAWEQTYGTLIPPDMLAEYSRLDERRDLWTHRFANAQTAIFVLEDAGTIVGFASAGPMPEKPGGSDPIPGFDAYLDALYLLRIAQGRGYGRQLLAAVVGELIARGTTSLAFHVLATNPAMTFYQHYGAQHVRDEDVNPRTGTHMCVYGWRALSTATTAITAGRAVRRRGDLDRR
jgi:GNAT superfamily N-acetyltransferase